MILGYFGGPGIRPTLETQELRTEPTDTASQLELEELETEP